MMKSGTRVKVDPVTAWGNRSFFGHIQPLVFRRARRKLEAEIRFFNAGMGPSCDVEIKMSWSRLSVSPDDARHLASLLRKAALQADRVCEEAAQEMGLYYDDEDYPEVTFRPAEDREPGTVRYQLEQSLREVRRGKDKR